MGERRPLSRTDDLPEVYTSRWQNQGMSKADVLPVRISVGLPKFSLDYEVAGRIRELEPEWAWLKASRETYDRNFYAKLEAAGPELICRRIRDIYLRNDRCGPIVLLCYEDVAGKGQECHRRMVAEWFYYHTGIYWPELSDDGQLLYRPELICSGERSTSDWRPFQGTA